jgi:hypothetical protein
VNKWTSCQTAQVSKRPNKRRNLLFSPFEWLNAEKARKNQQFPDTRFSPKSLNVFSTAPVFFFHPDYCWELYQNRTFLSRSKIE